MSRELGALRKLCDLKVLQRKYSYISIKRGVMNDTNKANTTCGGERHAGYMLMWLDIVCAGASALVSDVGGVK